MRISFILCWTQHHLWGGVKPLGESRSHNEKKIKFSVGVYLYCNDVVRLYQYSYVNFYWLNDWPVYFNAHNNFILKFYLTWLDIVQVLFITQPHYVEKWNVNMCSNWFLVDYNLFFNTTVFWYRPSVLHQMVISWGRLL